VNLLAPNSTSKLIKKKNQNRRQFVSKLCSRFVSYYLMQLDNFHAKGASGRKIRVEEVVVIHDKYSKRLVWETGVVKELLHSCDGLVWSTIVEFPNGNLLTRAVQCLYPIELREDQLEDVEIAARWCAESRASWKNCSTNSKSIQSGSTPIASDWSS
jgi:hypothetical protein